MNDDLKDLLESARPALAEWGTGASEEQTWSSVVELGWLLVSLPESMGGLGQGITGACAFYRELGRNLVAAPYMSAMLAIDAVSEAEFADRSAWLERMTAGDYVAVPMVDPAVTLTRKQPGSIQLNGNARAIPSADKASHVLLWAADSFMVLLPTANPGVQWTERKTWDTSRRLFDLRLDGVTVDEALVIAKDGESNRIVRRLVRHRDFALAADSVGGAESLLQQTVEYLLTRRQFGRPLGLFQALKHRCADLKSSTAAAEALLLNSLGKSDSEDEPMSSRLVKSLACSVYARVAEEAVQLHGGIGVTSEHFCHLFLKRALLNEHLGGSRNEIEIGASLLATS